jgi:hypothetical protein
VPKETESEPTKAPRFTSAANSKLPLASVIDDTETMRHAVKLLKEGVANSAKQSELKERESEIREELAAICHAYELTGFKHGLCGFEYHGYQTRQTLSKERLLALGVPADTIAQAYSEGKPFLSSRLLAFDME